MLYCIYYFLFFRSGTNPSESIPPFFDENHNHENNTEEEKDEGTIADTVEESKTDTMEECTKTEQLHAHDECHSDNQDFMKECNENEDQEDYQSNINIYLSATFQSFDEFQTCLKKYLDEANTHVVTRSSDPMKDSSVCKNTFPKKRIRYLCSYHRDPETIPEYSKSKGKRPKQAYLASNCPFEIQVKYIKRIKCYQITNLIENHCGHDLSRDSYESHPQFRRLNSPEKQKYAKFVEELKVPPHLMKDVIKNETGKSLKTQDIRNFVQSVTSKNDISDLQASIDMLEEHATGACTLDIVYSKNTSPDGKKPVKCIFWQSENMKKLLDDYGSVLFMDATYDCTNRGYALVTISIKDNHDKGKLVGWALVSEETKVVIQSALECLCDSNEESIKKVQFVVIDKDFTEIASLHKVIPHAHFIICRYHALKAVKQRIFAMVLTDDLRHYKSIIYELFTKMVYATTENEYMEAWNEIISIETGNAAIEELKVYFEVFWHNIRDHWAFYLLKKMELFDSFTNNRSEALNKNIKDCIPKRSKFQDVVKALLTLANNQNSSSSISDCESRNKWYFPKNLTDEIHKELIRIGNELVTRKVLSCLEEQYKKVPFVDIDKLNKEKNQICCPRLECHGGRCKYNSTNSRPCAHLFAIRKINKETILTPDMVAKRWLQRTSARVIDSPSAKKRKVGNFKEMKENEVQDVNVDKLCKNIAKELGDSSKDDFEYNSHLLKKIHEALRQKQNIYFDGETIKIGSQTPKTTCQNETFGFDAERKSQRKREKQPYFKSSSSNYKFQKSDETESSDLESWQIDINKKIVELNSEVTPWTKKHYTDFEGRAWLSEGHMEYFCTLLKHQFPDITGFQFPWIYQVYDGFNAVDGQAFIQPMHSGSDHWALMTNIGISPEGKMNEVIIYDSKVSFHTGSKTQCITKSAMEWQACQLLRQSSIPVPESIIINTYPCEQQQNGYDCGPFTLANAISLAFGINPEEIIYTGKHPS